jgi:hypothetical protein
MRYGLLALQSWNKLIFCQAPKLDFRHSDNINHFFNFVREVGLPEVSHYTETPGLGTNLPYHDERGLFSSSLICMRRKTSQRSYIASMH